MEPVLDGPAHLRIIPLYIPATQNQNRLKFQDLFAHKEPEIWLYGYNRGFRQFLVAVPSFCRSGSWTVGGVGSVRLARLLCMRSSQPVARGRRHAS